MFDLIPFATKSHDLFDNFDRRWNEMGAALGDFRTDITEEKDKYVLEAELPGFKREDINIDVEDDRLVITAKTSSETTESGEKKNYVHRERRSATYQRSFSISNIATEAITASYNDGILTLNLPKMLPKESAARKITVQ